MEKVAERNNLDYLLVNRPANREFSLIQAL
jgi:hypothetical protein